jgi:sigma-E factor negative regulatory protein RseC
MKGINMVSEQGMVEELNKGMAVVRVLQRSACQHCSSKDSCNISSRDILVEMPNVLQAQVGDYVEISLPQGALLRLSALVYLTPVIFLISGAFLGSFIAKFVHADSTWAAVTGGGVFLGIAFWGLRIFDRAGKRSRDSSYPRMTRILSAPNAVSLHSSDNI